MIRVPNQLSNPNFRFVKLGKWDKWRNHKENSITEFSPELYKELIKEGQWKPLGKAPFESKWQENGYVYNDKRLINHPGNYGVIGGYGRLRMLDVDNLGMVEFFKEKFKGTFMVKTGSGGLHIYLLSDYENNHVLINEFGEFRANNYQCVGPGSRHPNGNYYEIISELEPKEFCEREILDILSPYIRKEVPQEMGVSNKKDTSKSATEYRHVISLIKKGKSKEEVFNEMKAFIKWENSHPQYKEVTYNKALKFLESRNQNKERKIAQVFSIRGQVESFYQLNPFFYNDSKLFFEWNDEDKKYSKVDETHLLNKIYYALNVDTLDSKMKSQIVEGLKQVGRDNEPKKAEKNWVQFKEKVYDGKTGEYLFDATPEYHFMNPIPWNIGESEETPRIDELFIQWVGEKHKEELYEFIAYTICRDRFLQRIFALCGGGSNGKGTFMKLVDKIISNDNSVSSELKALSENQFEPSVLYGKLLCIMGEVSYDDLKNTNMIKKIAGEDKLSFQFKGKNPFTDDNTALGCCLTNSLPSTPDKSIGFYRKWHIIDFPNQFNGIVVDLISQIPDVEFSNLMKKSIRILSKLYKTNKLVNEGDFEERVRKYEERSNPVMTFVDELCEEEVSYNLPLREFSNRCNEYLKSKHLRSMNANQIGRVLRDEGFTVGPRKIDGISAVVILNLRFKTINTSETIQYPN